MNKIIFLFIATIVIIGCNSSNQNKHSDSGNNSDSLHILTKLIEEDSLNPEYLASRAELYLERGKIDPALRDLQEALELTPNDAKLFLLLSDLYFALGQVDNSIASLKKAIKLDPDNEDGYVKISETYLLLNKPTVAVEYANQAIDKNRQSAEAYYLKALGLLESNDTSAAIINFGISSNLNSNNYMTFMQLGIIYTMLEDTLSKVNFEKALVIKPNDERALYYLGMYYQNRGEFQNAIDKYNYIASLYPENKLVFYNSGYIYLVELEDFDNAVVMFQKAISINPRYVEAVYNLGRTYEAMGDYNSARLQYKKSLELLPNYPLAVQGMNRIDDMLLR